MDYRASRLTEQRAFNDHRERAGSYGVRVDCSEP